jgi:branched-chain amino acid transport system substrate-binding protein
MRIAAFAAFAALLFGGAAYAQSDTGPVKLGVLNDQSSSFAAIAGIGSVEAAKMAVADFGGSVLGKPVEIVAADHQNKPDVALSIARQWLDQDGVDVILDVANSGIAIGINNLLGEKKKLGLFVSALTDRMTEEDCNGYGLAWAYDAYSIARTSALAQVKAGRDTWFIISPDYAAGAVLEATVKGVIEESGGKVLGTVRAPLGTTDFSSYILQAQASKAKVIDLTLNGPELVNAMKQMKEFGVRQQGQDVAVTILYEVEAHAIGLETLQGTRVASSWYWDTSDESRAFEKRMVEKTGKPASHLHAGVYSATMNYLKAVQAAGSKDPQKVIAQLRSMKINDFYARNATLMANGRLIHDTFLLQVKTPAESKSDWDVFKVVASVPAAQAFRPISATKCPLVKK